MSLMQNACLDALSEKGHRTAPEHMLQLSNDLPPFLHTTSVVMKITQLYNTRGHSQATFNCKIENNEGKKKIKKKKHIGYAGVRTHDFVW